MSDESKALTIAQDASPALWGEREEIAAIARRLRTMLPNGAKLTENQLFAAGQYAKLTGLDPFTGGFTAMPDGGIFDGYKSLVAWAQSKELYTDKYYPLTPEELAEEGYTDVVAGWKCYLIRKSQQAILLGYLQAGFSLPDALEMVATKGIGVVSKKDTIGKNGQEIAPPRTWTWDRVAKKRALRAAIALGYGQPTLAELAALGERAQTEGWADIPAGAIPHAVALSNVTRRVIEASATMTPDEHGQRLHENAEILRGPASDAPIGEDPEPTPELQFYAKADSAADQPALFEAGEPPAPAGPGAIAL